MGRVRGRKVCEVEDREVTQDEIGRGYEWSKDQVVPISDDELSDLPLPTAKAVEIEAFVPLESVDPKGIGEGYYLPRTGRSQPSRTSCYGRPSAATRTPRPWSRSSRPSASMDRRRRCRSRRPSRARSST
ncbi:Ku protein [Streptomyces sp. NPDC093064]|uniref:Ku protein n=1 Tax=Streptomyces sp. NPDC093064 TaxID=3366020 RepID=UPI00381FBA11